jgi:GGDEF domain-containing protein
MRRLALGHPDTGALLFVDLDGFKQVNDRTCRALLPAGALVPLAAAARMSR